MGCHLPRLPVPAFPIWLLKCIYEGDLATPTSLVNREFPHFQKPLFAISITAVATPKTLNRDKPTYLVKPTARQGERLNCQSSHYGQTIT